MGIIAPRLTEKCAHFRRDIYCVATSVWQRRPSCPCHDSWLINERLIKIHTTFSHRFEWQKKPPTHFCNQTRTQRGNYLCPFAHFQKSADGVEGSRATDVKVGLVVRLQHPDEVITLFLKTKMKKSTLKTQPRHDCDYFTDSGATNFKSSFTCMKLPALLI